MEQLDNQYNIDSIGFLAGPNDIVLCGHGSYQGSGPAGLTKLPKGISLCLLQLAGSSMSNEMADALALGIPIHRVVAVRQAGIFKRYTPGTSDLEYKMKKKYTVMDLAGVVPTIYHNEAWVPDLILHPGRQAEQKQVLTVVKKTKLSELLQSERVMQALKARPDKTTPLRVVWASCIKQDNLDSDIGVVGTLVVHNAEAVAYAAGQYAQQHPKDNSAKKAFQAAWKIAEKSIHDASAAIAAAAALSKAAASQTAQVSDPQVATQ